MSKSIPVGLEKVIFLAAADEEFFEELLAEREQAAEARGFTLRESERAMLRMIPEAQLRASISGMDVSEGNLQRRTFMRAVAAGAAAVAGAEVMAGCSDDADMPLPDAGLPDASATRGIQPDLPYTPDSAAKDGMAGTGIRPDLPPATDGVTPPDAGSWLDQKSSWGMRPGG